MEIDTWRGGIFPKVVQTIPFSRTGVPLRGAEPCSASPFRHIAPPPLALHTVAEGSRVSAIEPGVCSGSGRCAFRLPPAPR